ncbi:MAG: hypothetical protein SOV77_10395 [Lachnospiraceae bacterium]|nr:hypothetical protein [Lachnospiraceae bacterium]
MDEFSGLSIVISRMITVFINAVEALKDLRHQEVLVVDLIEAVNAIVMN